MDTDTLKRANVDLWRDATRHPFLEGIRSGNLSASALDTWLAQDYQFVERLLRTQALVLAQAPRTDQRMLAQGTAALAEELDWFAALANERHIRLEVPANPACQDYGEFLLALAWSGLAGDQPYASCITAIWAVEQAYLDAWLGAAPGAPPFRTLVEHWTVPEFSAYVTGLGAAADRALATGSAPVRDAAEAVCLRVLRYERDFWEMAFDTPR